jgi:nitrogen PTS system EIIA component
VKLTDFIREELVLPDMRASRKPEAIRELAIHLGSREEGIESDEIERVLTERESLGSTAVGEGVAIPHGKLDSVSHLIGCFARSRRGVNFDSQDGSRTHFFFVVVAPQSTTGEHLKALARISRLFKNSSIRQSLLRADSAAEIYALLRQADAAQLG